MDNRQVINEEIREMMYYVLNRSDVRKSLKDKTPLGSPDDFDAALNKIDNKNIQKMLLELRDKQEKERNIELVKKYGRILLKESLFKKIVGK